MTRYTTAALAALTAATLLAPSAVRDVQAVGRPGPALWAGLEPGPHHVGYRRIDPASGVVHLWYPASAGGTPLRLRDYLRGDAAGLASFLTRTGVGATTVDAFLSSSLLGTDAAPAPAPGRRWPVVLVAQGNSQDVADQVVLCEHLASQGFVVVTTPSPMRRTPMDSEAQVGPLSEAQANDLAAALAAIPADVAANAGRLGVVGHSFGARAALLLAMREPRVRAIVSLDGGIGTVTALESFRAAPSYRATAPLPPLLHFYETLDEFMTPDFSLLKSLHTAGLRIRPTRGLHHGHFTTYGFAAAVFPEFATVTHASSATGSSVRAVAVEMASFLRRHVG